MIIIYLKNIFNINNKLLITPLRLLEKNDLKLQILNH